MILIKTLQQPFPRADQNNYRKTLHSFWEGVGVSLFFILFQPFGISVWKTEHKLLYLGVYGILVFFATFSYRVVLPTFFPSYFEEKKWVVWKEIVGVVFILSCISFLILVYHHFLFKNQRNDFKNVLYIVFLVILIGSIPVTISVLGRFAFLYKKYNRQFLVVESTPSLPSGITLVAENEKDILKLDDLLFIESADNYCKVVFEVSGEVKTELLRSSLTRLESQITNDKILRCHRSYIVNLNHVKSVTGNAQGYKLALHKTAEIIPVARKYSYLLDAIRT